MPFSTMLCANTGHKRENYNTPAARQPEEIIGKEACEEVSSLMSDQCLSLFFFFTYFSILPDPQMIAYVQHYLQYFYHKPLLYNS